MKLALPAASLLLALGMLAPAAMAFHGSAYTARGIATLPGNPVPYLATVSWNGYSDWSFTVHITDAAGAVVADKKFTGDESFTGTGGSWGEFFQYHGWSTDPAVHFDITGYVLNLFRPPTANMAYTGAYESYQLTLVVEQYE
jgi:hypothetical protein